MSDEFRKRKDRAWLERAMDVHGDAVFRVALSYAPSYQDAQDVTQDVFIKLVGSNKEFEGEEHLRAWLLRATINRCRDLRRSAWFRRAELGDDALVELSSGLDPADEAIAALEENAVWTSLHHLPPKLCEVATLFYVEGCSTEQIAGIIDSSVGAVRTRLSRARAQMRKTVESIEKGEHDGRGARQRL